MRQEKETAQSGWRGVKIGRDEEMCEQRKRKKQQRQAMGREKQHREEGERQKQGERRKCRKKSYLERKECKNGVNGT